MQSNLVVLLVQSPQILPSLLSDSPVSSSSSTVPDGSLFSADASFQGVSNDEVPLTTTGKKRRRMKKSSARERGVRARTRRARVRKRATRRRDENSPSTRSNLPSIGGSSFANELSFQSVLFQSSSSVGGISRWRPEEIGTKSRVKASQRPESAWVVPRGKEDTHLTFPAPPRPE